MRTKSLNLLLFFFTLFLFTANIVFAEVLTTHYTYTIDAAKDTLIQEVEIISNQEPGVYYTTLTSDYIAGEILDWKQTGGKRCRMLETVEETINGIEYTYIKCTYGDNEFLQGDSLTLEVTSTCNCIYKSGLDLFVYPQDHLFYEGSAGSIENIIYAPQGYLLYNSSVPASFYEGTDGVVLSFKESLSQGQSLNSIYGPLFLNLKKSVDFSLMEQVKDGKVTVVYPSGYENEAQDLLDQLNEVLPEFESYAGEGTTYDDITFRLVINESALGGYCGRAIAAFPAYNPENKDAVNLSITCVSGNAPFHELCHLAEKPFIFPSWFQEGQAENCGAIKLMSLLGRDQEVKLADEYRINSSKLRASIPDLGAWRPAEKTNESDNVTTKGYGLSYALFKEVLPFVDMSQLYTKMRADFKGYLSQLPNDALICKMNEVATSDIIPIFEKYGFTIEPCSNKTYYFLEGAMYVYRSGSWSEEVKQGEVWLLNETNLFLLSPEDIVALKRGNISLLNGAALLWLKNETVSLLREDETYMFKGVNGSLLVPFNQTLLKEGEVFELMAGNDSLVDEGVVLLSQNGALSLVQEEEVKKLAEGDWTLLQEGRLFLFKETKTSVFVFIFVFFIVFIVFIGIPAGIIYLIWRLFKKRYKQK